MNDFLPSTDNFFKYLLTIGLLLIVFTIMYPIQKQKEVDIEILDYSNDVEILNLKIKRFEDIVNTFSSVKSSLQSELDSLKLLEAKSNILIAQKIENVRIQKKQQFDLEHKSLISIVDSLKVEKINLNKQKKKIESLKGYYSFFRTYKIILLLSGCFLAIVGFRYWLASVYVEELKKGKDYDQHYRSSFIRHIEYCKQNFVNKFTIIMFICIILLLAILVCLTN